MRRWLSVVGIVSVFVCALVGSVKAASPFPLNEPGLVDGSLTMGRIPGYETGLSVGHALAEGENHWPAFRLTAAKVAGIGAAIPRWRMQDGSWVCGLGDVADPVESCRSEMLQDGVWVTLNVPTGDIAYLHFMSVSPQTADAFIGEVDFVGSAVGSGTLPITEDGPPAPPPPPPGPLRIAPKNVTWDGLDVVVTEGRAARIEYTFPADSTFAPNTCGTDVEVNQSCHIGDGHHPGEVIRVTAYDDAGGSVWFEVYQARHVEFGKYSFQLLEAILAKLDAILGQLQEGVRQQYEFDPTGPGWLELERQIDRLKDWDPIKLVRNGRATWDQNTYEPLPGETAAPAVADELKIPLGLHNPWAGTVDTYWFYPDFVTIAEYGGTEWDRFWNRVNAVMYLGFFFYVIKRLRVSFEV